MPSQKNKEPRTWAIVLAILLVAGGGFCVRKAAQVRETRAGTATEANEGMGVKLGAALPATRRESAPRFAPAETPVTLHDFIKTELVEMEMPQEDPARVERRLQDTADRLTLADRAELKLRVLDQNRGAAEKELALHLLQLATPASVPELESIALTPITGAAPLEGIRPDFALRVSAIEKLEKAALADRRYSSSLVHVMARAPERALTEIARLSLAQVAQGKSFFVAYSEVLAGGAAR